MKQKIISIIVILAIGYISYQLYQAYSRTAVYYEQGLKSINAEASSIKRWVVSGKAGTAEAASDLTGFTTKWNFIWMSNEEFSNYVAQVIGVRTHTPQQCRDRIRLGVEECCSDIFQVELDFVENLGKDLELDEDQKQELLRSIEELPSDVKPEIVQSIVAETLSMITGAVIESALVDAGILSASSAFAPETIGISVAIGVTIDLIISWCMDTEGSIKEKLDSSIDDLATKYEKAFKEQMTEKLNERRWQWVKAIIFE